MNPSKKSSGRILPFAAALLLCVAGLFLPASAETTAIPDEPVPLAGSAVRTPTAGSLTAGSSAATIDYSNTSQGYVMCKYSGGATRSKVQVTRSGGTTYTYNLNTGGRYEVFPLTAGNGSYTINLYEHVRGDEYALAAGTTVSVSLANSMLPFLTPSQYVNYSAESQTVKKSDELIKGAAGRLAQVANVYNYVVTHISYDSQKAATVKSGYLPVVDSVLASGKGICFDYAALMAAMLRSQGIPTQLRVGYAGSVYHAWISVYIQEVGWVNDVIYFDGQNWKLMDPTFASSSNQSADIMKYIGNGSNYNTVYTY